MRREHQVCLLGAFGVLPWYGARDTVIRALLWRCLARQGSGWCRWVEEYHVDGFRFDLASALCRDPLGKPMTAPPLIREMAKDPVLSKVL